MEPLKTGGREFAIVLCLFVGAIMGAYLYTGDEKYKEVYSDLLPFALSIAPAAFILKSVNNRVNRKD